MYLNLLRDNIKLFYSQKQRKTDFQNPRKASSRSRIFLLSLAYVFMYVFIYLFVSRLLAKRKTLQTRNLVQPLPLTTSKNSFFFEKVTLRAA